MPLRKKLFDLPIFIAILIICMTAPASASTWTVCAASCNYTTIQAAINNALTVPGDIIQVQNGTYTEDVTINKNNLTVRSLNGPLLTFINGDVLFSGNLTAGTLGGPLDTDGIDITGSVDIRPGGTNTISGVTIIGGTLQKNKIHGNSSGSGIMLDGYSITNIKITNNEIYSNLGAGVSTWDGVGTVTLSGNTIRNNSAAGVYISYLNDTTTTRTITIQSNYIYSNSMAGVRNDIASALTISGTNNIYSNGRSGIRIDAGGSGSVISQNNIYQNTKGGISIQNACTLEISGNTVRDNVRGGIHTGSDIANDYFSDSTGFRGGPGSAVLTIKKNKVYGNGQSGYGGGIDVRHASGTIKNNLVYKNHRGGIRFGWEVENLGDPHITEIINNTVVDNGNEVEDLGGGIVYDDLYGAVNDTPEDTPPGTLLIKNNITAYNQKAGLRACFQNTPASEERDYNLLYGNLPLNPPDCNGQTVLSCIKKQYGGCGASLSGSSIVFADPNDLMDDPLFVDMSIDDYHLQPGSPAKNAGYDNTDMGAYGGSDPLP